MVERLTAAEAASQIVGLINSRPVSPWPHEIEAIIARVSPAWTRPPYQPMWSPTTTAPANSCSSARCSGPCATRPGLRPRVPAQH